jgi:hypothetical protein
MGLPLFSDKLSLAGEAIREFALYDDPIVTGWQTRREIARSTSITLNRDNSIGSVQYLCTDEAIVPFSWLS